jgi:vancomycin resistance protein YoaR
VKQLTVLKILGGAAAAVIVLALSTVAGFEAASWNRIKPGIAVLDVPVGGLTLEEAQAKLAPRALAILDQPLQVQLDQGSWTTSARQLGVQLDPAELAHIAFGIGRDPQIQRAAKDQLSVLLDGGTVPVVGLVDATQVDALVQQIAKQVDRPARDAKLAIKDDQSLDYVTSEPGLQLDQPASRAALAQALAAGAPNVSLISHPLQPATVTDQVAATRDQLQKILDPQPIQLAAAEYTRTLSRTDTVTLISLNQPSGKTPASVTVNADALEPILDEAARTVDRSPVNARFTWDGANLSVTKPGKDGRAVDREGAKDALTAQLLAGARAIDLPVTTVPPAVSSASASLSSRARPRLSARCPKRHTTSAWQLSASMAWSCRQVARSRSTQRLARPRSSPVSNGVSG